MINPCKNCSKRMCPKLCEKNCEEWNKYKCEHDRQREKE